MIKNDLKMMFDMILMVVAKIRLNLNKCIEFGSDKASTMVGKNACVVT